MEREPVEVAVEKWPIEVEKERENRLKLQIRERTDQYSGGETKPLDAAERWLVEAAGGDNPSMERRRTDRSSGWDEVAEDANATTEDTYADRRRITAKASLFIVSCEPDLRPPLNPYLTHQNHWNNRGARPVRLAPLRLDPPGMRFTTGLPGAKSCCAVPHA